MSRDNPSDFQRRMTAYLDGELTDAEARQFEQELSDDPAKTRQVEQFRALNEELEMIEFHEPTRQELRLYWQVVYNRLERGLGWVLLSLGVLVLAGFGLYKLFEGFLLDPEVAVWWKLGVSGVGGGGLILCVSVARERMRLRRKDRYSKEVDL